METFGQELQTNFTFNIGGYIGGLVFSILIYLVIAALLQNILKSIPPQHRRVEPGQVWLLVIPLFNLVWNFVVFPKIAESFQSYFSEQGAADVDDCGRQLAFYFCIAAALSIIPCLGCLAGIAALVLLILVLVKWFDLKKRIPQAY